MGSNAAIEGDRIVGQYTDHHLVGRGTIAPSLPFSAPVEEDLVDGAVITERPAVDSTTTLRRVPEELDTTVESVQIG